MTQRLPGLSDQEATTGVAKATLDGSTKLLGRSSNLLRILSAHTPYLARWFIGFVAAVRQPNVGAVSDVKLRNLATIKTSMVNECKYCSTHTSIYGQALGVSEAQLEAMKGDAWKTSPLFSDAEIVEITLASAMFNMINRLNDTFWTELETVEYNRRQGNAVKGVTVSDIEAFANTFAPTGEAQRRAESSVAAE